MHVLARTEGLDFQSPRVQDTCWFKSSIKERRCTRRLEEVGGLTRSTDVPLTGYSANELLARLSTTTRIY